MKKASSITLLLLLPVVQIYSQQPVKSISSPYSWVDENNIVLQKISGFKKEYKKLNIKTLEFTPYAIDENVESQVVLKEGDIYFVSGKVEKRLTNTPSPECNPALSPDRKRVAFTRENDLYSIDIETTKETRLTFDGTKLILNGRASWVYYEEIFGRTTNYSAFWWSPDSKTILYYRFDDTQVPLYPIMNYSGQHGSFTETHYPKAGDPNPSVKLGFVDCESAKTVWADFDSSKDQYFGTPYWMPGGSECIIQWMNRDQDTLILYRVTPESGKISKIYEESQKSWVEWVEQIEFGSKGVYMVRDRDMWENIWYLSFDGSSLKKITEGMNWGTKIVSLDENAGELWFTSRGKSSVRNDVFRTKWSKNYSKISTSQVSTGEYNYKSVSLSPDKRNYAAIVSNLVSPDRLVVVSLSGKTPFIREIENSKNDSYDWSRLSLPQLVYITTKDGYKLPGTITYPQNFDKGKKYPVIFNIYGGPNSSNVMDIWKTPSQLSQQINAEGIIQVNVDNRASGHCGKEGQNFVYRSLGKYELSDFIEWVEYLRELPYIDAARIGINGFSYGGTMTALALTDGSAYFRCGVAGGGVYDWRLYDSHYTERYMDTPQNNPEGYRESAVLNKIAGYTSDKGSMLKLTHGTGDDNVHMQNTIQLIDVLINENKHFELMLYPGGMHGYRAKQAIHSSSEDILFWKKYLLER